MKSEFRTHARDYIADLAAKGIHQFNSGEAQKALGVSENAAKQALNRLAKQGVIASPARGFYVIVPPEYRSLGCLPAEQFIPALMQRLGLSYYAGLLSAAQYHGAAHHRPQEFQVMVAKSRRPIVCGAVRVAFIVQKTSPPSLCKASIPHVAQCLPPRQRPRPLTSLATRAMPEVSTR